jgi:hypothetical protein
VAPIIIAGAIFLIIYATSAAGEGENTVLSYSTSFGFKRIGFQLCVSNKLSRKGHDGLLIGFLAPKSSSGGRF